jgi:hypothetical protein
MLFFSLRIVHIANISNGAVGFGEIVRNTIFLAEVRKLFVGEKNWIWYFALNSFVSFLFSRKKRNNDN